MKNANKQTNIQNKNPFHLSTFSLSTKDQK